MATKDSNRNKRIGIPKSIRFEVFKRDSFKCQYCGKAAPDVVLHVDHIDPVANGGDNEIVNLITSCVDCNLGKSDRKLSDTTKMDKARAQMEDLQERRDQLEMMMTWHRGLKGVASEATDQVCSYITDEIQHHLNDEDRKNVKKWISKYSAQEVLTAVDKACRQYLKRVDGIVQESSVDVTLGMIPRICAMTRQDQDNPELQEFMYVRGILRSRFPDCHVRDTVDWMKNAFASGVSIERMKRAAKECYSIWSFKSSLEFAIEEASRGRK